MTQNASGSPDGGAGRIDRSRPNIILIIADDLGYGDLGCHGNSVVETPHIDRLYNQSTRFTRFYGGPMCSPSRASLMTGRYHYRTGVVDTYIGRSMMYPDETTLAQVLSTQGYRTGIFGKWHLGDNFPMRPQDQGFDETLVHRGGGIGQPGDTPGNTYFDPTLQRNGTAEQQNGYCTDIFTENATDFISESDEQPAFACIATNAPHTPLQVEDRYIEPYRERGLNEQTARVYAMVSNLDENLGKLLSALERQKIADNTIVIFTSDHGMAGDRYNAGLRGSKGDVYEGGIRVPFFIRWPNQIEADREEDQIAHFIDVLPTLADITGASVSPDIPLDGTSLRPILLDEQNHLQERELFLQMHRGDEPTLYENCAVVTQQYKLINGRKLFNLQRDSGEQTNIATQNAPLVSTLRDSYESWFDEMEDARDFEPPKIVVGAPEENPTLLTRQDWLGPDRSGWSDEDVGYWDVKISHPGKYDVTVEFTEINAISDIAVRIGDDHRSKSIAGGRSSCTFESFDLTEGTEKFEAWLTTEVPGKYEPKVEKTGVKYMHVVRDSE
ncbi:arylsulfatase [Halocatena marina]|uniref:arylsulfatase n=1 Tax=Halocatena marina TaxID=2934937 RepID=UPI00200D3D1E|nr:arylsulfatase [Halocatena marina]